MPPSSSHQSWAGQQPSPRCAGISIPMLSVTFLFAGAAFDRANRLERGIRWTFISAALIAFASFIGMTWHFGLDLEYRFEVTIFTVT
jgi:hypothetical protein